MNKWNKCWNCGEKEPTEKVYGMPLCKDCAKLDIDPEDLEDVVIESLCRRKTYF